MRGSGRVVVGAVAASVALLAGCSDADRGTESVAQVADDPGGEVTLLDGWVRATTGAEDTSMTGAFMRIENTTDRQITLAGASADVAARAEIHEMVMQDGAMVMQPLEGGLEIAAGETAVLQPGGNHVMLMGLDRPLAPGDEVTVTLQFADGSTQESTFPVKAFTEEEPHYHGSPSASPSR